MSDEPVQQAAPAAADIEDARGTTGPRGRAAVVELADLGCGEIGRSVEQGAGIDHPWVEPELKELVAQIVMPADRLAGCAHRFGRCRGPRATGVFLHVHPIFVASWSFDPAAPACQFARSSLAAPFRLVDNRRHNSRGQAMRWPFHSKRFARNLVLLHTETQQALSDWVTVREKIEARAPDIDARLASNDEPNPDIYRWQVTRPSLVISPFRLLAYRPPGGTVYVGKEMGKVAEWLHMVACGLPIPHTVRLVPGLQLPPETWGEYVVLKPVKGLRGRDIRLLRTEEVGRRYEELSVGGRRRMLVQQYIENLNPERCPTSY